MAGKKELVIVIDEQGSVHIEAKGYGGQGCLAATKEIEEALGAVEKRTIKAEMYQSETTVGLSIKKK